MGRDAELAWLERCLQEAIAGRPQLTIVVGGTGVGKSRLQREFCERAQRAHLSLGFGRGDENMALPYRLLASALEPHLDTLTRERPDRVMAARRVLCIEEADVATTPPASGSHDEADRARAYRAVELSIIELTQARPLLLCLDDLHWGDRPSLELLLRIVRAVDEQATTKPVPLMILCGSRPIPSSDPLSAAFERLQREPRCTVLELEGLRESEVCALLSQIGGGPPPQALVEEIHRLTRGNPLYVRELGQIVRSPDGGSSLWPASGDVEALELPSSLHTAVAERVGNVDPQARELLRLAACLGERFSLARLAAVSGRDDATLLKMLGECVSKGLLSSEGSTFSFGHPLLRQCSYQELSHLERGRTHLRIADILVEDADASEGSAAEIASHLVKAGPLADASRLARFARAAGDQAFASYASGEAARFYEAVLTCLEHPGAESEAAELRCLAGIGYYREGNAARAIEHLAHATDLYESIGDVVGAARSRLEAMRVRITLEPLPLGTRVDAGPLEASLRHLPAGEEQLRGRILSVLAGVHWIAREPRPAIRCAQEAIRIGERVGDLRLQSEAWSARSASELQSLMLSPALASNQQGLRCARQAGDAWLEAMALCRLPLVHAWSGDLDAAEQTTRASERVVRLTHDWAGRSLALAGSVATAVARGRFAEAEELGAETLRAAERSGYPWGVVSALPAVAWSRLMRGDPNGAEAALARLDEPGYLFPEPGAIVALLLWVYRSRIRVYPQLPAEERSALVGAMGAVPTKGTIEVGGLGGYAAAVEIADVLGDPAIARAPRAVLARAERAGIVLATGWVSLLPRILGVASALARRWADAERRLADAIVLASQREARAELALAYLEMARTLRLRGRRVDERRVRDFAGRAVDVAGEIGMHAVTRRAAELGTASASSVSIREAPITGHWLRSFLARAESGDTSITVTASELGRERPTNCVIMMTDMVGSTRLLEELGTARALEVMQEHNRIVRAALAEHQGTEIQHTGDGIFAIFIATPRAVACARTIQRCLSARAKTGACSKIRVRVGIASGPVLQEENRLFGAPVVIAARLCASAKGGQILVSDEVRNDVHADPGFRDLGRIRLAGFQAAQRVHAAE